MLRTLQPLDGADTPFGVPLILMIGRAVPQADRNIKQKGETMMKNEGTRSVSTVRVLGVLAVCALLVTGCTTSLNHVGAFSQASADLAKRAL